MGNTEGFGTKYAWGFLRCKTCRANFWEALQINLLLLSGPYPCIMHVLHIGFAQMRVALSRVTRNAPPTIGVDYSKVSA